MEEEESLPRPCRGKKEWMHPPSIGFHVGVQSLCLDSMGLRLLLT